jgi:hypothetical protein
MQIKLHSVFLVLFLILRLNIAYPQKPLEKFGKIDAKELTVSICPIDKEAHAYYIFDYGKIYFEHATKFTNVSMQANTPRFQMNYKRHLRIKILDNQAFDLTNIKIPLYHGDDGNTEKITNVKGITYNLENGKVIKTKFDKKDIKIESTSKNWKTVKFAMPNVKAGSVVEVEYSVRSHYYFNLPVLRFQHTIPTLYSEYDVAIPEYLIYSQVESGYYPIQQTKSSRVQSINTISTELSLRNSRKDYNNTVSYTDNVYLYQSTNIPAFPREKYLKARKNYISKITFELQSSNYPEQEIQNYSTTWQKVNAKMDEFYQVLENTNHLNRTKKNLLSSKQKGLSLLSLGFEKVKNHFTWNDKESKYPTNTLNEAYQAKEGNSADINLNLVVLLRELGFEANPVILSTQRNGFIHPSIPSLSGFNYVIARVKFEDKIYLLDATEPYSEINLLPTRCLNDKGLIIGEADEEWMNLMGYNSSISVWNHTLSLQEDLTIQGTVKGELKKYAAYHKRKAIKKGNGVTKSNTNNRDTRKNKNAKRIIKNISIKGLDVLGSNLDISYDVNETDYAEASGDLLYFSPVFDPYFDENPFKLEKREFPVEFDYPIHIQEVYNIKIPDNYIINELPKSLITQLSDKSVTYMYKVSQMNNRVHIMSILSSKKSTFISTEYQELKQIFQMIAEKQKEFVVLKKK